MTVVLPNPPQVTNSRLQSYSKVAPRSLDEAVSFLMNTAPTRDDESMLRYAIDAILNYSGCQCSKKPENVINMPLVQVAGNVFTNNPSTTTSSSVGSITFINTETSFAPAANDNGDKVKTSEKISIEIIEEETPAKPKPASNRKKRSNG